MENHYIKKMLNVILIIILQWKTIMEIFLNYIMIMQISEIKMYQK